MRIMLAGCPAAVPRLMGRLIMKAMTIVAALAAAGLSSAVYAQRGPDPWGDATVTRAEEQTKADERFTALDTDKDGILSADEQKAAESARGPGGPGGPRGGLRRADGNGDGKITKDEYVAAQLERFDRQDADKDGNLTKAERDAARARFQQRDGGGRDGGHDRGGFGGGAGGPDGGFGGGGFGDD